MKISAVSILFLLLSYHALHSQTTNSPYSILGIGDIDNDFYNRTSGMANTGQAYRSDRFLISNNPASYTALQQQFFSFELSAKGQFVNYSGTPLNGSSASKASTPSICVTSASGSRYPVCVVVVTVVTELGAGRMVISP